MSASDSSRGEECSGLGGAEYWVIRLSSPDCSEEEHREFEDWLAADRQNAKQYARAQDIHIKAHSLRSDDLIMAELSRIRKSAVERKSSKKRTWIKAWGAAVAALVVLVVAPLLWGPFGRPPESRFATGVGEIRDIRLDDGTRVKLDTDSQMIVNFNRRERLITLVQGRVQFDVAADSRPLMVTADRLVARDIGTVFEVRRDSQFLEIGLLSGLVVVQDRVGSRIIATLNPGQVLTQDRQGKTLIQKFDIDRFGEWTRRVIHVRAQRLDILLAELNRYSTRKIRLANPADGGMLIDGRYRTDNQEAVLISLEKGFGFRVDEANPSEIVLTR